MTIDDIEADLLAQIADTRFNAMQCTLLLLCHELIAIRRKLHEHL